MNERLSLGQGTGAVMVLPTAMRAAGCGSGSHFECDAEGEDSMKLFDMTVRLFTCNTVSWGCWALAVNT